ncbi:MAG: type I DNA topoisomerase [Bacteroidales bacterium]|nr:type I DNA topoisomerase [Bacteroidales bacterium]MDD4770531.1 type I DNA topoisomerase [Bacteroidales bacterium]
MQDNLIIVESPAKAKTIEKFLGKDYKVLSSFGHIRDLSKKDFGVDLNNGFKPIYEISADKQKLVGELKSNAKKAKTIWLASDEDREGEAIAWHLAEVLNLDHKTTKRIVFHEITKEAILHAIEHPRAIDQNLVDAQQARRILDRLVGFELSPVLWKKIKPSLSAGRVQSVSVRLIVERERAIQDFQAESNWRIVVHFILEDANGKQSLLKTELQQRLKSEAEALAFLETCKSAQFNIEDITTKPGRKSPAAPFTTSTLQQEAARKLGYSVSQTMMIAQRLYESGKITYMRTDSVNLSNMAIQTAKAAIMDIADASYIKERHYQTKSKGAQEAHEAIRPTYMNQQIIDGTAQEKRLYELIWKRTLASQMADAEFEKTAITIGLSNSNLKLEALGEVLTFDGFLKVYMESTDEDIDNDSNSNSKMLPPVRLEDQLEMTSATATERFSQRPARYTEASLVRKLEELGIGRPSTYAPTISTIQQRGYVRKEDREGQERSYIHFELSNEAIHREVKTETTGAEKNKLFPTDIGMVVNDFLLESFPNIMNYNFTAQVEKQFDQIADGEVAWDKVLTDFYTDFHPAVEEASVWSKQKVGERILGNDPKTGRVVSVRIGRYGPIVQIGTAEEEEKPLFASLQKDQRMDAIELEDALELFKLPRTVGSFEEKTITVAVGRFGPYIRHNNKFVSLPKTIDPLEVDLETCIELIELKREADQKKQIMVFEEANILVLNGRYGPYISKDGQNYKIPKDTDPLTLTLEACQQMIEEQEKQPTRKRTPAKKGGAKTSTKKVATKKTATSKKKTKE